LFELNSAYQEWEKNKHLKKLRVLDLIWKNLSPTKAQISVWQAIQNRIASRSLFVRRGIIAADQELCPFSVTAVLDWWHLQWVCPLTIIELLQGWLANKSRNLEKCCWDPVFVYSCGQYGKLAMILFSTMWNQ